jgi:hypothetical protein
MSRGRRAATCISCKVQGGRPRCVQFRSPAGRDSTQPRLLREPLSVHSVGTRGTSWRAPDATKSAASYSSTGSRLLGRDPFTLRGSENEGPGPGTTRKPGPTRRPGRGTSQANVMARMRAAQIGQQWNSTIEVNSARPHSCGAAPDVRAPADEHRRSRRATTLPARRIGSWHWLLG